MYWYVCPNCGCHLDPGEKCDCRKEREEKLENIFKISKMIEVEKNGQMKMMFKEAV